MKALDVLILLLPVAVNPLPYDTMPVDCADVYRRGFGHSGVYTIYPAGETSPIQVYCDMGCEDQPGEGKWTVIQKRKDGTVNFYRGWDQYRSGFGQASGEYWLGLENIHLLTQRQKYELRVDMEDFEGAKVYVQYSSFSVASEHEGYKLHLSGFKDGGAGKSMDEHNGQKFSTFDKDQDSYASNCAKSYLGGWWYGECQCQSQWGISVGQLNLWYWYQLGVLERL